MSLKLLGALILIFATGSVGFTIARNMKKRVLLLSNLRSFIQILITEIDFAITLLPDALLKTGRSLGPEINLFCQHIIQHLQTGLPLSVAWETGLDLLVASTALQEADLKPMKALAPVLGLSDRRDQLRHLQLAQEHLKIREIKAEQEAGENQKLWRYLGVLGGLVIALLLV